MLAVLACVAALPPEFGRFRISRLWQPVRMRVATWNVNSVRARLPRLLLWLSSAVPDVVCLQELKCRADDVPATELGCGVGLAHFDYKLRWLRAMAATVHDEQPDWSPFAVLVDFNVAPTDADVWDVTEFSGCTHVPPAERVALAAVRGESLVDVYPRALEHPVPFTYWDYRALGLPNNLGQRIDLVYADASFAAADVDRDQRKSAGVSDHAAAVIDLDRDVAISNAAPVRGAS